MSEYFDKDFFKFLLGFLAIVLLSLVIIFMARAYNSGQKTVPNPVINTASPKS